MDCLCTLTVTVCQSSTSSLSQMILFTWSWKSDHFLTLRHEINVTGCMTQSCSTIIDWPLQRPFLLLQSYRWIKNVKMHVTYLNTFTERGGVVFTPPQIANFRNCHLFFWYAVQCDLGKQERILLRSLRGTKCALVFPNLSTQCPWTYYRGG